MNKVLIVLVPAAVGLGVGLLLATEKEDPILPHTKREVIVHNTAGPDHSAELDQLRREVRALSREQGDLLERVAPSEDGDEAEVMTNIDPQAEAEANVAALIEQGHELDEWFYQQESDPEWKSSAEDSLYGAFAEVEGLAFEAECAAAACRIELGFGDSAVRDSTMSTVPFMLPWAGEAFVTTLDEEGLAIAVYVAREGTNLPRSEG